MDRIELNAVIERLIESRGRDGEARDVLAEFAAGMKQGSPIQMLGTLFRPGGSVSGETPEQGNIKVEDEKLERREFEKGVVQERIGYYKLTRQKNLLVISHYWKSDPGTQSETEPAPEWALALKKGGQPGWFGERAVKRVFRLPLTSHFVLDVTRNVYVESWGPAPESQHPGALLVAISVSI